MKFEVNLKQEPTKLKETHLVMVLLHDKQKGNSSLETKNRGTTAAHGTPVSAVKFHPMVIWSPLDPW